MHRLISLPMISLLLVATTHAAIIAPFRAHYTLYDSKHQNIGSSERSLRYTSTHQFLLNDITQINSGNIHNRLKLSTSGESSAHGFTPKTLNTIVATPAESKHQLIPAHSYDIASAQLQLQYDLLTHKKKLSYPLWHGQYIVITRFHRMGMRHTATPLGTINALMIQTHPTTNSITKLYFAPKYNDTLIAFQQFNQQQMTLEGIIDTLP